jgi:acetyl-CoA C-acetyltransferase
MPDGRIAIVAPVRTAVGSFGCGLRDVSALDLGAHVTREAVSRRAVRAIDEGLLRDQITAVPVAAKGGAAVFDTDEHPRRDITPAKLARLKPAFREDGTVTAGNSSGINDGAAALVLMPESRARQDGRDSAGYLRGWASVGVEPQMFGIGPVPAVRKLLDRVGLELNDIGLVELNVAFASSTLAVIRT